MTMKIQSEVFLREDIGKIVKALMLAGNAYPDGQFKDGYAHGLRVLWAAICQDANVPGVEVPRAPQGLTGWEDVDSSIFAWEGFRS